MPEPTSENSAAPAAAKTKRGEVNKETVAALDTADKVCAAAAMDEYKSALADEEISAAFVVATATLSTECRTLLTGARQDSTTRGGATKAETAARNTLISLLHDAQSRARQKHEDESAAALKDYYVSTSLESAGFAELKQISGSILEKLPTAALPGMNPTKIAAIATARDAWLAADTSQSTAQTGAGTKQGTLKDQLAQLLKNRRKIQLAADRLYPPSPTNSAIRRLFQLPVKRRFT